VYRPARSADATRIKQPQRGVHRRLEHAGLHGRDQALARRQLHGELVHVAVLVEAPVDPPRQVGDGLGLGAVVVGFNLGQ
jgi:hypothetical protein